MSGSSELRRYRLTVAAHGELFAHEIVFMFARPGKSIFVEETDDQATQRDN